jgi:trigger factor
METTEIANPLERRLDIAIAIDAVKDATDTRLKRMARNVKMPGFRPGKVPFPLVRQQYGAEAYQEALGEALNEAFGKAVTERQLNVAGRPRIEPKSESSGDTHHEFSAIFEVYPDFALGDLSGAEVERPVLEVSAAEVDKTLEILRRQRVRYVDADRAAVRGDRVVIDFSGKKDGTPFEGGQGSNYPFVLGKGMMLPAFEEAVEGMRTGETKTFDLTFPEDYFARDMASQTVQFELHVRQVMAPVLPEIDAEFARALGIADGDLGKMRVEVESNLKREVKKRIKARLRDQAMHALLAANPIPVPNALVELEVRRLMEDTRRDLEARGMQAKHFPARPEWFAEQAKQRVTLGLIFAELIKSEDLRARPEQVRSMVEDLAQTYEKPEEVVQWYYAQPGRLADMENQAVENNVVEWVLSKVRVVDKTITFDELMHQKA